jgi:DNA-binding transcriptional regulator YiaG
MKYDSFRTYLTLLESLGKRLDPGNVSEMIEKQISDMENRIVARIDDRISSLEKKLDAVLEKQNCVSFSVKDDDCVACVDCVDDITQDTQLTQITQITQRLESIEDSINSSRIWWTEIEQHVRGISDPKLEEVDKKLVILDRQIGEIAKETDEALNMGRSVKQEIESVRRKASDDIAAVMKETAGLAKFLTPDPKEPKYEKLAAEYDDLSRKYDNSKKIIRTMNDGKLFPDDGNKTFKEIKKKKGMSQSQIAEFLGVSRNKVANWESGRSSVPPDIIRRLNERGSEVLPSVKLG